MRKYPIYPVNEVYRNWLTCGGKIMEACDRAGSTVFDHMEMEFWLPAFATWEHRLQTDEEFRHKFGEVCSKNLGLAMEIIQIVREAIAERAKKQKRHGRNKRALLTEYLSSKSEVLVPRTNAKPKAVSLNKATCGEIAAAFEHEHGISVSAQDVHKAWDRVSHQQLFQALDTIKWVRELAGDLKVDPGILMGMAVSAGINELERQYKNGPAPRALREYEASRTNSVEYLQRQGWLCDGPPITRAEEKAIRAKLKEFPEVLRWLNW